MKKKTNSRGIPTCPILADLGKIVQLLLTDSEIKTLNAYFYFKEIEKTAIHLRCNKWLVNEELSIALRKVFFIYGLPSRQKFLQGYLTKRQFLEAPIKFHNFSMRLYHVLVNARIFNLKEALDFGGEKLAQQRGFGDKALLELLKTLEKKGCGHLLQKKKIRV
jgi:Bacterial RNA polymerase, alpha chain C terminal domain